MRQVFAVLGWADFITPIKGLVDTFLNDPSLLQNDSWTFFIPYSRALKVGWNMMDIEKLLKQHGVKSWGVQYQATADEYFFTVSRNQAGWAEYLLNTYGVPINERFRGAPVPRGLPRETIDGSYEVVGQPKKSNPLVLFLKAGRE